jgi:hypothetical protein
MFQQYSHVYSGEHAAAVEKLVLDIDVPNVGPTSDQG